MPIVPFLVVDQYRRLTRRVDYVAVRSLRQGQPTDEMWIGFEGVVVVIKENGPRRTGEYDRVAGTGPFERQVMSGIDDFDMFRIQLAEIRLIDVRLIAHPAIITAFGMRRVSGRQVRSGLECSFNPPVI